MYLSEFKITLEPRVGVLNADWLTKRALSDIPNLYFVRDQGPQSVIVARRFELVFQKACIPDDREIRLASSRFPPSSYYPAGHPSRPDYIPPQEHFSDWNTEHEPWKDGNPLPMGPMLDTRYTAPIHPLTYAYNDELSRLIGMAGPKAEVKRLADFATITQKRKEQGLPKLSNGFHMSFTGNPGTGKTTFARIVARVLKEHGILPRGHCVEVDRSELVGPFIGHSEKNTLAKLREALGGVLFIDEAYSLNVGGNDYGGPVIDAVVKFMEDHRDQLCVILAGYTEPMKRMIASNPGLKSRISRNIHFSDYSAEELTEIFDGYLTANKYTLAEDAYPTVARVVRSHHANRGEDFGNARDMRSYFERVTEIQASRAISDGSSITHILKDDIEQAAKLCLK